MKTVCRLLPGLVLIVFGASTVHAAVQGTLGTSSTGSAEITISKGDVVLITNITDVNFGVWKPGDGDQSQNGQACVYSSTGNYSIQATSTNGTNTFQLDDGASNQLEYTIAWIDDQAGAAAVPLASGQVNATTMAGSNSQSCNDLGGSNVRFLVEIDKNDLAPTPPGTYADILVLTVAPI